MPRCSARKRSRAAPRRRAISVPSTSITPACGVDDAGEQAQEGGFAAARGADQQKPLALMQGEAVYREREGVPARPSENHVRHLDDGPVRRRAGSCGRRRGLESGHMIPVRSRLGLSRLTSKLDCPFGEITETSSSCAPAKTLKYSKVMEVSLEGAWQASSYSAWNSA